MNKHPLKDKSSKSLIKERVTSYNERGNIRNSEIVRKLSNNLPDNKENYESEGKKCIYFLDNNHLWDKDSNRFSTNKKHLLRDITSEVGSFYLKDDVISDNTSITSCTSIREVIEIPKFSDFNKVRRESDPKKIYQNFVKIVLKVKFEKLHNSHRGREIPEKLLFKECIKRDIAEADWYGFIYNELQIPQKYLVNSDNQFSTKKAKMFINIG